MPWGDIWEFANLGFLIALLVSAVLARRWRLRQLGEAVAVLPGDMRRLVGPEPYHLPPPEARQPEGLRGCAERYRQLKRVSRLLWGLVFLWLAAVFVVATVQTFGQGGVS